MNTKVYYMGRHLNGRFSSFKSRVKAFIRKSLWALLFAALLFASFVMGAAFYSTNTITVTHASAPYSEPAVLQRIADCESGNGSAGSGKQFNKFGAVVLNANTNKTVDIGKFQINSIHEGEAQKLGFDLFTEEGNTGYARYLYENKGTGDWASSSNCWHK
jgi:hypothetical protein